MEPKNIEELFGTLTECITAGWRKHLKTDKYSKHMALDEFYKEMPELVDDLIEGWQGEHGKVDEYINVFDDASEMTAIDYLENLHEFCKAGRKLIEGEPELESDMDSIMQMISSTLYKLKELNNESYHNPDSLRNFLLENIE